MPQVELAPHHLVPVDVDVDAALARDVAEGLSRPQKALSSAWFYDDEGSRLFQEIMALPEYYLTRVEEEILRGRGDELAQWIAPGAQPFDLIELGSGDGAKTLALCQALVTHGKQCVYYPIDLSALALEQLRQRFGRELPQLPLRPLHGDYFSQWPHVGRGRRQVALFMGSNLGNLTEPQAIALLRRIRRVLRAGDALVLGLDLQKDPQIILAAYDDAQGVTARFNLNLLVRLNRELEMDFVLDHFRHYATYSPLDGAARSFLISQCRQLVHSRRLRQDFAFRAGEAIYTEQSQKYTRAMIDALARASGFTVQCHLTDARGWYTVVVWQATTTRRA